MNTGNGTPPPWYRYWGKAGQGSQWHLLPYHSLDVAACGLMLLRRLSHWRQALERLTGLSAEALERLVAVYFSFHDLGKFATGFQNLRPDLLQELQGRASDKGYLTRHDTLGYLLWRQELRKRFLPSAGRRRRLAAHPALEQWMRVVTGHHGRPPAEQDLELRDAFDLPADVEAAERFMWAVLELWNEPALPLPPEASAPLASWWLAGLMVVADWLGSNARWFPPRQAILPLADYWRQTLEQAEVAVQAAGLEAAEPNAMFRLPDAFGEAPAGFQATPLQQWAAECPLEPGPALYLLEDFTGSGKTEAALILAQRLMRSQGGGGLYFALPTMATANGMYQRLAAGDPPVYQRLFCESARPSLVLAHGQAGLVEAFRRSVLPEPTPEEDYGDGTQAAGARCARWLADNRKKALLAEVGVGTIDQALLGVLPSRHQSLRLLGLLGKVLVVDEVHACDTYMNRLLEQLLQAHARAGGSAILLSATLPAGQRRRLLNAFAQGAGHPPPDDDPFNDYPLATALDGRGASPTPLEAPAHAHRHIEVEFIHEESEAEARLGRAVKAGACACWICNTVNDACRRFERLRQAHPEWKLELFHARFALGHRLTIEAQVLDHFGKHSGPDQRQGRILIATQVVEQSLDLDFDHLVTDLAPIDLMIQRAGRLHRHTRDRRGMHLTGGEDRRDPPRLTVLAPAWKPNPDARWLKEVLPGTAAVYQDQDARLWLAMKLLQERGGFHMPRDARELVEAVYGADDFDDFPEGLLEANLAADGRNRGQRSIADLKALHLEEGYRLRGPWLDEESAPTRLGEPTATLWLVRLEGERLLPLVEGDPEDPAAWQRSALSLRRAIAHREVVPEGLSAEAWQALKETLPNQGRWGLVVIMSSGSGSWYGQMEDELGRLLNLIYDDKEGLRWKITQ